VDTLIFSFFEAIEKRMEAQHPQIELYVSAGSDEQNAAIERMLDSLALDLAVENTLQAVGVIQPVMLTLLITDDDGIREMNKQYREQDKSTDVLSFPLLDRPLVKAPADQLWMVSEEAQGAIPAFVAPPGQITNLGDIMVSWPTVLKQATEAGHSAAYELLYLIAHGLLHLVGYDDQSEAGYQTMVHIQRSVLQALGQRA
jgi:probable rRNA maturation factor